MKELKSFSPGEKIKYGRARLKEESLQMNMGEKDMKETLNTTERLCYQLLITRSDMGAQDIRDLLPTTLEDLSLWMGKTIRQTQRTLKSLEAKGWIESKGKREFGKANVYQLTVDEDYTAEHGLSFENKTTLRIIEGGKGKSKSAEREVYLEEQDRIAMGEDTETPSQKLIQIPIGD